jgi:hypothetical protein
VNHLKLKRYLGDGAYAGFDGYQIWVWAERDGITHAVALEPGTMASLAKYVSELKHMAHDVESLNQEQM